MSLEFSWYIGHPRYKIEDGVNSEPTNRRRSERVMLEVPVIVLAETPEGEQLREEAQTVVVNAHGGLMKLKMELLTGQPLILVNAKTNVQERCRVVRVEYLPGAQLGVAFEFDRPAPQFWPIVFPPTDWNRPPS